MKNYIVAGRSSALTWGVLFTLSFTLLLVAIPCHANQSPASAYDHYIGHFGAKNVKPPYLGAISATYYDGGTDDLLTAGLGKTGLAGNSPALSNPPTAAELRRKAIHTNYRAVLDITEAGGYGTLYGPNVSNDGDVTASEGKIPGWEYIAYSDDGSGRKNVALMVQVPYSFDVKRPCIVTATSSGSRGIYGAIGASGEWGLKQGCAVAYTDKGTGNGLHDLETNTVGLIDGTRDIATEAGTESIFAADISEAERAAFNIATPDRVAYKHAHSQQNPEGDWGKNTLQAVHFAFYVLNETYGRKGPHSGSRVVLTPKNTIVIASGVSNGGTGALQAAEQDLCGLIDGVAVTEPNAQPADTRKLKIIQGGLLQPTIGKPLYDYFTVANLYQPCAALAVPSSIVNLLITANAQARCDSLHEKGLVSGADREAWAADALAKLRAYGWLAESDILHASHYALATNAIAVTYSNALGRVSVLDSLCGFSFANTNPTGDPILQDPALQLGTFSTGNGVPPTSGVNIVYNLAANNSAGKVGKKDTLAESPSTKRTDYALDGAICHRNLVEGEDIVSRVALSEIDDDYSQRIQEGIDEVVLTARLRGKPAIIVHGRSDALVPVNHSSRAYYGTNKLVEGCGRSRLSYIEVTNAQHFDAFLPFPEYAAQYVPLHVYLIRALNDMYDHLTTGRHLPPSQVVRGVPRGTGAPAITEANVPPVKKHPAFGDRIWFIKNTLYIPD